ncbi:MAG: ATP-binding cassette domain-containing protein [Taibaiella sp.]|nr:ATP-binding cassette domain-containing protein [Taibaiella sp.]
MGQSQTAADKVITIEKLTKSFGTHQVLSGFDLELSRGESIVVLGRSGSGKSVLIKCLIGLHMPDSGSVNVLGNNMLALDQAELDKVRARVGFLFQGNALYDSMTVRENLEFPMRRHMSGVTPADADKRVRETLAHVGLEDTIDMMPAELSGGMQKRIALARTLILHPEIILYDEPTTGLDPITAREISSLMNHTKQTYNTSSIIISHDMKCVEQTADNVAVLVDGRCHALAPYQELARSSDNKVRQFFD